jgi:hypothetical protein
MPFPEQEKDRRVRGLVLEVKGDFSIKVKGILESTGARTITWK